MLKPKEQLNCRVRYALKAELEAFAANDKRKLGNVIEILVEWGFEHLKSAGSVDRLLKCKIELPSGQT